MCKLIEGMVYLFNFTKANGEHRTMIAKVVVLAVGSKHVFVDEILADGTIQPRTIVRDRIVSVNAVKIPLIKAETGLQSTQTSIEVQTHPEATKSCVEPLKADKQKYSFKKVGSRYIVKCIDKIIGEVYTLSQVGKLVEFHKSYKSK